MNIVLASQNEHKKLEIQAILRELNITIKTLPELGFSPIEVVEDQDTFEGNALKKAYEVMKYTGLPSIADDSGLCVEALNNEPGVYSARFAGENASDLDNNSKLIQLLKGETNRKAKFVSVIALVFTSGDPILVRGECHGTIISAPKGAGGFGYDPLFIPDGYTKTFGELSSQEKNAISHRANALDKLKDTLYAKDFLKK